MIRGDIANEIPRRIIVTLRSIAERIESTHKKFWIFGTTTTVTHEFDRSSLSLLWKFVERTGVTVELVVFDDDGLTEEDALGMVEAMGTAPINYCVAYESIEALLGDLPFRPEVLGVLDAPQYSGRYGGWAITPLYFERVL